MPEQTSDVLIVGAGPTGLTLAIELHRLGLSVRLVDKAAHGARWSQALIVQARTLEQWERYGIAETPVREGRKVFSGRVYSNGEQIVHMDFHRIPGKYPFLLFYPQRETEQLLRDHLAAIGGPSIERSTELLSFTESQTAITACLRLPDGSESTHHAAWILGADGAHSVVRTQLGIPFSGEAVSLSFLLGDLVVEGEDDPGPDLTVHFKDGDVIFLSRLSDRICRVIYARHQQQEASSGSAPSNTPVMPPDAPALDDFNAAFARSGIRLRAAASDWSTPFHVNDRQAGKYRIGRALIAGDASHIHSPVGGQGMNTGLQDAANLAWKLAAVHRGAPDSLLDTYQEERSAVGKALLSRTGFGLRLGTATNPFVRWIRDLAAPELTRLPFVQKAIAGFMSETAIDYRGSTLSADHGGTGSLHAGDRVPNPTLADGRPLLGALSTGRSVLLLVNTPDLPSGVPAATPHLAVLSLQIIPGDTPDSAPDAELAQSLGTAPAFFVIRPDGYLGLRAPTSREDLLVPYLHQIGAL